MLYLKTNESNEKRCVIGVCMRHSGQIKKGVDGGSAAHGLDGANLCEEFFKPECEIIRMALQTMVSSRAERHHADDKLWTIKEDNMKNTRKLLCAVLLVAVLCISAVPAFAAARLSTDTSTIYMRSKNYAEGRHTEYVGIYDLENDDKVTSPKSSNPSSIRVSYFSTGISYSYPEEGPATERPNAYLNVTAMKPGKAAISVKVNGKAIKTNMTAVEYVNPVKSLVLTGLGNKNLKAAFNTSADAYDKLTADAKAGQLKVAAASGWKLRSMYWNDSDSGDEYEFYNYNGVSSAQINVPKMVVGKSYYVGATFKNVKTGGTIDIYYRLSDYDY